MSISRRFRSLGSLKTAVFVAALAIAPSTLEAQTTPAWKEALPERAVRFGPTPVGSMLMQLKTELVALNPETGEHLWSRKDATDYQLVSGTPLVVLSTTSGATVADVDTGRDRWVLANLGFTAIKGRISLPEANLLLVYGQTKDNAHTLIAAEYSTGRVIWTQAALFSGTAVASKASKIEYRTYLVDTPASIVLDPTQDGLLRLDLQTGRVIWRLAEAAVPSKGKRVSLYNSGDQILIDENGKAFAINREGGNVAWSRTTKFPSPIVQAAITPRGILVRGSHTVNGKGVVSWKPYLAVLNPMTGATQWTTEKTKYEGRSEFLLEDNTITVALKAGLASFDLESGRVLNTSVMEEFSGRETPCCLERMKDGRLRVWSSQNLRLFDASGATMYSVYLKAPGASFMAKLATMALAVAMTTVSMGAAQPGGFYQVYSPGADSAMFSKFKATVDADAYTYVFTEEAGSNPDRFALVRIDKATGEDTGRVRFTDRSPSFQVDPVTGIVVVIDAKQVSSLRFPATAPKG